LGLVRNWFSASSLVGVTAAEVELAEQEIMSDLSNWFFSDSKRQELVLQEPLRLVPPQMDFSQLVLQRRLQNVVAPPHISALARKQQPLPLVHLIGFTVKVVSSPLICCACSAACLHVCSAFSSSCTFVCSLAYFAYFFNFDQPLGLSVLSSSLSSIFYSPLRFAPPSFHTHRLLLFAIWVSLCP
jgi:hypothetical protein